MSTADVRVVKVEIESDDNGGIDATVRLRRPGPNAILVGYPPQVDDLPPDLRDALRRWLGASA